MWDYKDIDRNRDYHMWTPSKIYKCNVCHCPSSLFTLWSVEPLQVLWLNTQHSNVTQAKDILTTFWSIDRQLATPLCYDICSPQLIVLLNLLNGKVINVFDFFFLEVLTPFFKEITWW